MTTHEDVTEFLSRPGVVDAGTPRVHVTHIARVFVGSSRALKIKRPVKLTFLDFSSLDKRHAACLSELAVNRDNAPDIYLGVVPITREANGLLAIGGTGMPVEWAVEMRAFANGDLLSQRAEQGELDPGLMRASADAIYAMHQRARPAPGTDHRAKMNVIVDEVGAACRAQDGIFASRDVARWEDGARAAIQSAADLLRKRALDGAVRRCHGDLHLANIVVWQGKPTLFDALEFSEEMATVDVLYDLAFLLMDLAHKGQTAAANAVLNRYLWRTGGVSGDTRDIEGLALMPLFLSCRAAIRAMVAAARAADKGADSDAVADAAPSARDYLAQALNSLSPAAARLIAVGGLSGTGKSTLASALAALTGGPLGGLHLRTDLERKAMMGVDETNRLPPEHYTSESARRVYERVLERAEAGLRAGQCVITDAVFATHEERAVVEQIAERANVPFTGLWLEADAQMLRARVAARRGDASDATLQVIERQLGYDVGPLAWQRIAAGGPVEATLQMAQQAILGASRH